MSCSLFFLKVESQFFETITDSYKKNQPKQCREPYRSNTIEEVVSREKWPMNQIDFVGKYTEEHEEFTTKSIELDEKYRKNT